MAPVNKGSAFYAVKQKYHTLLISDKVELLKKN